LMITERRGHGFWYAIELVNVEPALFDLSGRNRVQ
jgi:hypothetical protein